MKNHIRLPEIDIARGLLVLLVVVGHTVQQFPGTGEFWRIVYKSIYAFHMPAFAAVAGLCMYKAAGLSGWRERCDYLGSRALRLLVPYCVWGGVYFALRAIFPGSIRVPYYNNLAWMFPLGYSPAGATWFLWVLFVASMTVTLCGKWCTRLITVLVFGGAAILFKMYVPYTRYLPSACYQLPIYIFAVSLGVYMRSNYEAIKRALAKPLVFLALAVLFSLAVSLVHFQWTACPKFPRYIFASALALPFFLSLSLMIERFTAFFPAVIAFLGTEAMAIYMFGEPIKQASRKIFVGRSVPLELSMFGMMALMIVLSILIHRLAVARSKWLSLLLVGEAKSPGERSASSGLSTVDAFKHLKAADAIEIDDAALRRLQLVLVGIVGDIAKVCDENGIVYMLGGGSALGARRHRGFIPWDDDVDINLPRADYDRFIPLFRERFGDRYDIHTPEETRGYGLALGRIRLKGTSVRTREDLANGQKECGAFVDLFIIENTFDNPVLRAVHGFGCQALGLLYSCRKFFYERRYTWRWAKENGTASMAFRVKLAIGIFLSPLSLDFWTRLWNRWNRLCRDDRSKFVTIPVGRRHFWGEMGPREDIATAGEALWEGETRKCPKNLDGYLRRLYGPDYMTPPPPSKREKHTLFAPFDLGQPKGEA